MQKSLSFVVRLYFTSANYYLRRDTTVLAMPGQNQNIKSFFTPLGTKRTNDSNGGSEEPVEKLNKTSSDYDKLEFDCKKKSEGGKECNLKISTWNVASTLLASVSDAILVAVMVKVTTFSSNSMLSVDT